MNASISYQHVKDPFQQNPNNCQNLTPYTYEPVDSNNGNEISHHNCDMIDNPEITESNKLWNFTTFPVRYWKSWNKSNKSTLVGTLVSRLTLTFEQQFRESWTTNRNIRRKKKENPPTEWRIQSWPHSIKKKVWIQNQHTHRMTDSELSSAGKGTTSNF